MVFYGPYEPDWFDYDNESDSDIGVPGATVVFCDLDPPDDRPSGRERPRTDANTPPYRVSIRRKRPVTASTATSLARRHTFFTVPLEARPRLKATESVVERVYSAAYKGLKGDSLALAAGLMPVEFNRLKQVDPLVELAVMKGRADAEEEMSDVLIKAAREGDAKAALDVLKHQHGWTAAQQVNVSVQGQISITDALKQAEQRVIDGVYSYTEAVTYTEDAEVPQIAEKLPTERIK